MFKNVSDRLIILIQQLSKPIHYLNALTVREILVLLNYSDQYRSLSRMRNNYIWAKIKEESLVLFSVFVTQFTPQTVYFYEISHMQRFKALRKNTQLLGFSCRAELTILGC